MASPISKLEELLCAARDAGASDVHLTVGSSPRMRVEGELITMDAPGILPSDTLDILLSVMNEAQRDLFEASGEYDFSISFPGGGRCRASAYKQKGSVAFSLRLLNREIPSLEGLGVPNAVEELCRLRRGLVLVTGLSGSGKSSTLAAMVDYINSHRNAHIVTLEDPIEYIHPHKMALVSQREIGVDSRDYVHALRAALREDPDVIMVGELCGCEAVNAAVAAAETGCLVLASLNTADIVSAIGHIIYENVPDRQPQVCVRLADVLEAVVCQRLCLDEVGGQKAVFEVLRMNQEARSLIREGQYLLLAQQVTVEGDLQEAP